MRGLGPAPGPLEVGVLLDYELRLHGVPFRWRTEITAWEPPLLFAERQARGPFLAWAMRHELVAGAGGAVLRETVEYRAPGGRLGRRLAGSEMARILRFRGRRLLERASSAR